MFYPFLKINKDIRKSVKRLEFLVFVPFFKTKDQKIALVKVLMIVYGFVHWNPTASSPWIKVFQSDYVSTPLPYPQTHAGRFGGRSKILQGNFLLLSMVKFTIFLKAANG